MKKGKTINRSEMYPANLVQAVKGLGLTRIQTGHLYKFIGIIEYKQGELETDSFEYVPLSNEYIVKVFSSRYIEWLKPALKANIIEVEAFQTVDTETGEVSYCEYKLAWVKDGKVVKEGKSKHYRINHALLTCVDCKNDLVKISYQDGNNIAANEIIKIGGEDYLREKIIKDVKKLTFNRRVLNDATVASVEGIEEDFRTGKSSKYFKFDAAIEAPSFKVYNVAKGKTYYTTLTNALKDAKEQSANVIQYKDKFFIDEVEYFLLRKQRSVAISYWKAFDKLCSKVIYANRNATNNRLDTNLTSLPKILFNKIVEENGLVEIDLKNSQYAILADLLVENKVIGEDVEIFKEMASNGILYEYVQKHLGYAERSEAKMTMMEIIFSKHGYNSSTKSKLKELFPNVVAFCDGYKKENGDSRLAILLQNREADIFIDTIYHQLQKQGVYVLTKHDSIIVKQEDKSVVVKTIKKIFHSINFKATINQEEEKVEEVTIATSISQPLEYYTHHYGQEMGRLMFDNEANVFRAMDVG